MMGKTFGPSLLSANIKQRVMSHDTVVQMASGTEGEDEVAELKTKQGLRHCLFALLEATFRRAGSQEPSSQGIRSLWHSVWRALLALELPFCAAALMYE